MIDERMIGDKKNMQRTDVRFRYGHLEGSALPRYEADTIYVHIRSRVMSARKNWILEAPSVADRNRWVNSLKTNIYFANPAKRDGGVSYAVFVLLLSFLEVDLWQLIALTVDRRIITRRN